MASQCGRSVFAVCLALVSSMSAQLSAHKPDSVTPVLGPSWLQHLHRSFDETSMGKTGRLGPMVDVPIEETIRPASHVQNQPVALRGADLYRLNCRGCHGEFGLGAPPEINSVIDPVRSSSATLVMERMKNAGMDMKPAEAAQLAKQSQHAIVLRLHKGGEDMPAFEHLNDEEIRALMAYLRELADVPGAGSSQFAIRESRERIGEHIVKSTCHTCHSTSGANPDPRQLADGAIPPLSTLTSRVNQAQFIRKVTQGATIEMGAPAQRYRGRMPVFYYLSEDEVADAYLYLTRYAPDEEEVDEPAATTAAGQSEPAGTVSREMMSTSFKDTSVPPKESRLLSMRPMAAALVGGALVSLLLVGMAAFTVRECMRLSLQSEKAAQSRGSSRAATQLVERLESKRIA